MILAACKILHSSFCEVDAMDVETLIELLDVWDKLNDTGDGKKCKPQNDGWVYIDDIL